MRFVEIRPFVRFALEMQLDKSWKQTLMRACDHRLFYVTGGRGVAHIEDSTKQLSKGDVLYWQSGTRYRLAPAEEESLSIISVNFDFTRAHESLMHSLPKISENEYREEDRLECVSFEDAPRLNGIIMLEDTSGIGDVLRAMDAEARRPDAYTSFQLSALMTNALCLLARQAEGARVRRSPSGDVIDYVHAHFTEPLTNRMLAAIFNYHENYISQLVRQSTGLALHQYLIKVRVDHAIRLLKSTDMPISEIAAAVGFRNFSYFSQYFKKQTGHRPSDFRLAD